MLNITLLWHMHQPYYVNPLTKTAMMPWVRLHCVRGYLDMIDVVRRYQNLRVNFNFTPVLVLQITELAEKKIDDLWEQWSRKPADELTDEEKARILENFFKINWENLINPFPRYLQLLEFRGRQYDLSSLKESIAHFTAQDYRDLQTWYNLAWCGFSAQKRFPELAEFKKKGSNFTEAEKNRVLDIHHEIVSLVLKLYREAQEQNQIEITTTPFFHPIMPLVYDTDIAKRCMPAAKLPPRFQAPEDVKAHLKLAQEQHEKVFGRRARGMWPSEGSVCPEIVPLMREAGIEYFCADEGILFRSLNDEGKNVDHLELFQAWHTEYDGAHVKILFRERPLSDYIGFNASRTSPEEASDYLVHHFENIENAAHHAHNALCVALDGENCWEAFPDGGESFLCQFYEKILRSSKLTSRRLGDYFDEAHNNPHLSKIYSGSWINSDFDIWIGDPEENQGWEWLGRTRSFLVSQQNTGKFSEETLQRAWKEIYAAEGSDWFWWYGPDFQTDCDFLFDELFRTHLQNVYRALKIDPPEYLEVPICLPSFTTPITQPFDYIDPILGEASYYDWMGAGRFDVTQQQTAMFQSDRIARQILYGFNEEKFFFRLDTQNHLPEKIVVYFYQPHTVRIVIDVKESQAYLEQSFDAVHFQKTTTPVELKIKDALEMSVPHQALGWDMQGKNATFMVQIFEGATEKERYPERGLIEFPTPSPQFKLKNWFV
ncbi:MAG: glycoside hydrolase family 57 protein [Verrucomicrobiota bacterium]